VLAREVFDVDGEGYALVRPDCNLDDPNVQELARTAARNCPERAIVVDDE
jgi:ferredoxin